MDTYFVSWIEHVLVGTHVNAESAEEAIRLAREEPGELPLPRTLEVLDCTDFEVGDPLVSEG